VGWYNRGMEKNKPNRRAAERRILLAFGNTGASGRDFLYGFSRYSRSKPGWILDLEFAADIPVPGSRERRSGARYDGIVADATMLDKVRLSVAGPKTRIVLFGDAGMADSGSDVFYVQTDDVAVGRFGARSLMSYGNFMSFGYVPVSGERVWSEKRGQGFWEALSEAGRECRVFREGEGRPIGRWLADLPKPAALLCACDVVARAVVERCKEIRIRVPEEVSVLGVDNDETVCELESPSISSILPDHDATGYAAAQSLDRMFDGRLRGKARTKVCDAMRIVTRESTAPIPPASQLIRQARAFIARNATSKTGVEDVARHLGVSRALLDLRFRQFAHTSVHAEIESARLEAVRRKLLSTALPIKAIAASCGYKGAAHLGVLFRRKYGTTMSACRASGGQISGANGRR